MAKKHAPAYTRTRPSYVHPSLQRAHSPPASASSTPPSVTQRIQQLRREQASRPTAQQCEDLAQAVSRTVPPELRRLLHLPEVDAPIPKAGMRPRRVAGAPRPPPGPAIPTSWLQASRHATPRRLDATPYLPRFSTLATATARLPPRHSLVHLCLRVFASHWHDILTYEQHYVAALPTALKEALLSYLALYGAPGSLDLRSFNTLFQLDEAAGLGPVGSDDTRFLDLSHLLNERYTLGDVAKYLKRPSTQTAPNEGRLGIEDSRPSAIPIADSWEVEADAASTTSYALGTAKLQTPHFANLSRLSLAHPAQNASWADLVRISPHLNKITHLSLAYWPRPSVTPNANTASMVSKHTSVSLGGSHFYSDLDHDWHEAANLLRRLSVNTYSLQWLDLEGCFWLPALTWRSDGYSSSSSPRPAAAATADSGAADWDLKAALLGPDWNDAWRRVTYLHFFQGWLPCDHVSLQNMPAGVVAVQLMRWVREHRDEEDVAWRLDAERSGSVVQEWVAREKTARIVGSEIHGLRKRGEGVWCDIDHGWGKLAC